ncbi:hypothetical protein Tsubulata_036045, partial [Turnera subulata]
LAKAWVTWFLKWRAPREAGFTEQRQLPGPGSGRITGRCQLGPSWFTRLTSTELTFFFLRCIIFFVLCFSRG